MRAGPILLLLLAAAVVFTLVRGQDDRYTLVARFDDAAGLREHSRVHVAGQTAGDVSELKLGDDDRAVAVLRLDKDVAPVGRDARAEVRAANLLGEKVVDLHRGDVGRPLPSGTTLGTAQTSAPVELDDLLDTLDTPTRAALSALVNESGVALSGRSADFRRALAALPSSLSETGRLLSEFATDNTDLRRLVEHGDRLLGSVAARRKDLGRFVQSTRELMGRTAARQHELDATLAEAPGAASQLRRSLAQIDDTVQALGPAARTLQANAAPLTELLRKTPSFVAAARPALARGRAAAPRLDRLGRRGTPVVSRLRPVGRDLGRFARSLAAFSGTLHAAAPDALAVLEGWARAIQVRDAAAHLFRNNLGFTSETVTALFARMNAETRRKKRPPAREPSRPATAPVGQTPTPQTPKVPLPKPPVAIPDVAPALPPARDTGKKVDELLDFLLGP